MPVDPSKKSFRFIGDEIDKIIERVQKAQARIGDDAQARKAVKATVAELKACRADIRKKFFLPTWFLLR